VRQAKRKNNAPFMSLLAKCLQQDDGAHDASITFVVRQLNVTAQPVPGVLASPIAAHVQPPRLVSNGGEVIDVQATEAKDG